MRKQEKYPVFDIKNRTPYIVCEECQKETIIKPRDILVGKNYLDNAIIIKALWYEMVKQVEDYTFDCDVFAREVGAFAQELMLEVDAFTSKQQKKPSWLVRCWRSLVGKK